MFKCVPWPSGRVGTHSRAAQFEDDLSEVMHMLDCNLQLSGHKGSIFEYCCGQSCRVWDLNLVSKHVRTRRKLRHSSVSLLWLGDNLLKKKRKKETERRKTLFWPKVPEWVQSTMAREVWWREPEMSLSHFISIWKIRKNRKWGLAAKPQGLATIKHFLSLISVT